MTPTFDTPSKCLIELWELQNRHKKNVISWRANGTQSTRRVIDELKTVITLLNTFESLCLIEHNTNSDRVIDYYREKGWYDFPDIYL